MVQEAFLRVLAASERYRSTARFRTYFYRVITRLCIDRTCKKQPLFTDTLPECPDACTGAADAIMKQQTALQVRDALNALPPCQRMAVILRYYEDLSYKKIASAMDTTPKAVEGLLSRARMQLKSSLGNQRE